MWEPMKPAPPVMSLVTNAPCRRWRVARYRPLKEGVNEGRGCGGATEVQEQTGDHQHAQRGREPPDLVLPEKAEQRVGTLLIVGGHRDVLLLVGRGRERRHE